MFKKILLGLGLLGVISSANAICTLDHFSNYKTPNEVSKLQIEPGEFKILSIADTCYVSGGQCSEKYYARADNFCNVEITWLSGYNSVFLKTSESINPYATTFYIGRGGTIDIIKCSASGLDAGGKELTTNDNCYFSTKITNTSVAPTPISTYNDSTLKSEDALMKARIQALETKVYQCVQ